MKKLWLRICSMVLVMVMVMNSLPLNVWAEQNQTEQTKAAQASETETISTEKIEDLSQKNTEESIKKSKVLDELPEERTEYSKTFLLDSGIYMAVVYGSAAHFEENGQWKDIDNTLIAKSDGTITNTAGVWDVSFPQQLSRNNKISITKDGHTLSFGMAGELRKQDNLELMSEGNESIALQESIPKTETVTTIAPESEPSTEETTAPVEEAPAVIVPEQEAIPEESAAAEVTETVPETQSQAAPVPTVPEADAIDSPIPAAQETISTELTSVKVNGVTEIFAVSTAKTALGDVQKLDFTADFAAVDHKETVLTKNVSQLKYADVYTNTDVQYDIKGNTVKESLILDAYDSKLRGYRFTIDAGDMIPVMNDDQSIYFYDKEKKNVVMTMPAPFLMDKDMNISYDVQLSLT